MAGPPKGEKVTWGEAGTDGAEVVGTVSPNEPGQHPEDRPRRMAGTLSGLRLREVLRDLQDRIELLIGTRDKMDGLLDAVLAVASGLEEQGFGPQLLAAVFRFDGGKYPVYFIYGYKRGAFWPFVPKGEGQERDNATELELRAKLEQELPIENDLTRWFGVFDAPL
jgi:hypothetical protein